MQSFFPFTCLGGHSDFLDGGAQRYIYDFYHFFHQEAVLRCVPLRKQLVVELGCMLLFYADITKNSKT